MNISSRLKQASKRIDKITSESDFSPIVLYCPKHEPERYFVPARFRKSESDYWSKEQIDNYLKENSTDVGVIIFSPYRIGECPWCAAVAENEY